MTLGAATMMEVGNNYTSSLPAWIAAAFEEAAQKYPLSKGGDEIAGQPMVLIGYGSGDASTSTPITPVHNWQEAAKKINISEILNQKTVVELSEEQYNGIHAGKITEDIAKDVRKNEFVIEKVGTTMTPTFQDLGVEYYKFIQ